jgi:hypothetical protein
MAGRGAGASQTVSQRAGRSDRETPAEHCHPGRFAAFLSGITRSEREIPMRKSRHS